MTSHHPSMSAAVFTHASSVIAVVRCSDGASGTVTHADRPSNDSALPYLPAVQVAFATLPAFPDPELSATVSPVPSLNAYAATRPDVVLVIAVASLALS